MRKLLIICIFIIGIVFISGCTSDENAEKPMSSETCQESDTQSIDLIIKPSEVSGFTLEYHKFYSVPKNTLYVPPGLGFMGGGKSSFHRGADSYTDTLRMGHRNVGEESSWRDKSGKELFISLDKFDSDPDSLLIESFNLMKEGYESASAEELASAGIDFGNPDIGDDSYYIARINPDTDVQTTAIQFIHGNTFVLMYVVDEKGISKKTAIRIAKIIKSRLD
ncbi:MAG: hypothetical protein KAJ93_02080 [Methanosarcinales archaeon]|nr:hypothetical protein [Methanosarcinales archaeon]